MLNLNHSRLKKLALSVLALSVSSASYAAAFSVFGEASGKNSGDYGAGVAAEANDASTLFYNPAGLVLLDSSELTVSGTLVRIDSEYNGNLIWEGLGGAVQVPFEANNIKNNAVNNVIPSIFYARKVSDRLAWGVGLFVPFGLKTDWGETSNLRYAATSTKLQVIDLSPAFSTKLSDTVSFGAAFDIQYAVVDYNLVLGLPNVDPALDSIGTNHGDSVGFGVHGGLMWQAQPNTRVGLSYHSEVTHQFRGVSELEGQLAGQNGFAENDHLFSDPAHFPATTTAGIYHQWNTRLALMASASFIQWSSMKQLVLNDAAGPGAVPTTVIKPMNFRDTWRVVGGAKYRVNDKWLVRGGIGWDQTPTNDVDRDVRLPDADRVGVAIGAHYQYSDKLGIDAGWTHLFISQSNINNTLDLNGGAVDIVTVGNAKGSANLLGAQLTWKVD